MIAVEQYLAAAYLRGDQIRVPEGANPRLLHLQMHTTNKSLLNALDWAVDDDPRAQQVWQSASKKLRDPALRHLTLDQFTADISRLTATPPQRVKKLVRKPTTSDLNYAAVTGYALLTELAAHQQQDITTLWQSYQPDPTVAVDKSGLWRSLVG